MVRDGPKPASRRPPSAPPLRRLPDLLQSLPAKLQFAPVLKGEKLPSGLEGQACDVHQPGVWECLALLGLCSGGAALLQPRESRLRTASEATPGHRLWMQCPQPPGRQAREEEA